MRTNTEGKACTFFEDSLHTVLIKELNVASNDVVIGEAHDVIAEVCGTAAIHWFQQSSVLSVAAVDMISMQHAGERTSPRYTRAV